ncbi:U3 small nucleolar RNA-associated protein 11 [Hymenopellis radicata]|nr:U3 small nucleolar RNA-associated protein 11 [Hymenopellis radicata]
MTSSLRNSIHRRNHKERSQLAHRAKFGILEKHKDYVKRARDYHSKQDKLTRLKQKASERNKDEFYFSMTKQKTKGGVHIQDRGNVALPTEMVKMLKTQDENYIRTMRAAGQKKIDKLKAQLSVMANLIGGEDSAELEPEEIAVLQDAGVFPSSLKKKGKAKATHIVFVDDEQSDVDVDMSNNESTDTSLTNRRRLLRELAARLNRDKQLRYTEREFEMQRQMMGKGARTKLKGVERVDGGKDMEDEDDDDALDARKGKPLLPKQAPKSYTPRVYKWHAERKR